jgi:hypothetical protein
MKNGASHQIWVICQIAQILWLAPFWAAAAELPTLAGPAMENSSNVVSAAARIMNPSSRSLRLRQRKGQANQAGASSGFGEHGKLRRRPFASDRVRQRRNNSTTA